VLVPIYTNSVEGFLVKENEFNNKAMKTGNIVNPLCHQEVWEEPILSYHEFFITVTGQVGQPAPVKVRPAGGSSQKLGSRIWLLIAHLQTFKPMLMSPGE